MDTRAILSQNRAPLEPSGVSHLSQALQCFPSASVSPFITASYGVRFGTRKGPVRAFPWSCRVSPAIGGCFGGLGQDHRVSSEGPGPTASDCLQPVSCLDFRYCALLPIRP